MKPLVLLLAALSLGSAWAQPHCGKPTDDFDGFYCLNRSFVETDEELNSAYQALVAKLPGDARAKLRKSQLAWIEHRNKTCSRRLDTGFFVNLACATQATRQRLEYIEARLQECESGACQTPAR
jgi:uncharacterized protein YecT (DUF1311 family)